MVYSVVDREVRKNRLTYFTAANETQLNIRRRKLTFEAEIRTYGADRYTRHRESGL